MTRLKLYSGTRSASSWAMRAWLALREAGLEFDEEVVDIRRPQRFANLAAVARFSPPAAVPVLIAGEAAIFDSLAIMEYANDAAGGCLLPADPVERAQARSIVAWQHSGLSNICARISFESAFYPLKRALTGAEAQECERLFTHLEHCLERSDGPYLFGDLSLADLMLAPTVVRLASHAADLRATPRCRRWSEALLSRASVEEWLTEAREQPHIWFDDYLLPGAPPLLRPSRELHAGAARCETHEAV